MLSLSESRWILSSAGPGDMGIWKVRASCWARLPLREGVTFLPAGLLLLCWGSPLVPLAAFSQGELYQGQEEKGSL